MMNRPSGDQSMNWIREPQAYGQAEGGRRDQDEEGRSWPAQEGADSHDHEPGVAAAEQPADPPLG